jgi:hypothetical protein
MRIASILDQGRSGALLVLVAAFVVSACSPAAAPTPSPTAVPTPTVAPTLTAASSSSVEPSVAPSASTAIKDPTIDLKIAAPYQLVALDPVAEAALRQQITGSLGAMSGLFDIGVRQVTANGNVQGFVMAMGFPAGILSDTTYKSAVGGLEASLGVTFKTSDVSGVEVSSATNATAGYAAFKDGDNLMLVITPAAGGDPDAIAKALITANK